MYIDSAKLGLARDPVLHLFNIKEVTARAGQIGHQQQTCQDL